MIGFIAGPHQLLSHAGLSCDLNGVQGGMHLDGAAMQKKKSQKRPRGGLFALLPLVSTFLLLPLRRRIPLGERKTRRPTVKERP